MTEPTLNEVRHAIATTPAQHNRPYMTRLVGSLEDHSHAVSSFLNVLSYRPRMTTTLILLTAGRTAKHEASLPAELIHDAENLTPGKLGQTGKQALKRAWPFLNQMQSNRRLNRHGIHPADPFLNAPSSISGGVPHAHGEDAKQV
jgi:hypothetical protein